MAEKNLKLVNPDTGEVLAEGDLDTIERMADEGTYGPSVVGTEEQLTFKMGSDYDLNTSSLKVGSIGSVPVKGQFQEGNRVKLLVEVEIESISFPPIKHKGFRVGTERRHEVAIIDVTQAD